ncbi:MAG: hypothetical protein F4X64_05440 [Chloroflexi bacterium]|nr:hypothetical protein [Chloroflexota bacterium]
MAAATWLVWFYTTIPCTPENAIELMCRPAWLSSYVSTAVLRDCIVHSGIAITITGGSDIMLFLQERRRTNQERQRNDQMMEMMKAFLEEAAEQRRQIVEERRQAEERAIEERRQAEERAIEERRQAAVERQAFLEALNRLTDAIIQNGRNPQ